MKRKVFAILLTCMTLGVLSGCADNAPAPESTAASATADAPESTEAGTEAAQENTEAGETESTAALPEEKDIDYATGTPWLCSMIEGVVTKDTPADPKDDFYIFANKDKLLSGVLTDEKPETGTMIDVDYKVTDDIRNMYTLDYPESHDARLVYDLYHLAADWESRDAVGVAPLVKIIDEIEAVSSIDELNAYFTRPADGEPHTKLWRAFSLVDPVHSDRKILMVNYCLLLRGDSAEYSDPTPLGDEMTNCERKLAEYVLVRTGCSEEEAKQKIMNVLTGTAICMMTCTAKQISPMRITLWESQQRSSTGRSQDFTRKST